MWYTTLLIIKIILSTSVLFVCIQCLKPFIAKVLRKMLCGGDPVHDQPKCHDSQMTAQECGSEYMLPFHTFRPKFDSKLTVERTFGGFTV